MARINIEDSLFRDSRYQDLILKTGSRWTALGMVTEAWYLAQEFFLNEDTGRMIPLDAWKKRKAPDAVIEVGLAEVRGDKVYVCGSAEQFNWLLEKTESGRRGGLASAQKRAEAKLKQNQAGLKQTQAQLESASSTVQADSSEAQANASESNPLTLSLTHTLNNKSCEADASHAPHNVVTSFFEPDDSQELEEIQAEEPAVKVLTALNTICFKNFRPTSSNLKFINGRLKEGYSYEDFLAVIKHRQSEWGDDSRMSQYLRPKTLFNSENFDGYVQAAKASENMSDAEINELLSKHIISLTGSYSA